MRGNCAKRADGMAPLLLLDEIAAHLDAMRRAALFEEILALGAQAWMTGTDIEAVRAAARTAPIFSRLREFAIRACMPSQDDHGHLTVRTQSERL